MASSQLTASGRVLDVVLHGGRKLTCCEIGRIPQLYIPVKCRSLDFVESGKYKMSEIISFCQSRRSPAVQSGQDNVVEIKLDYANYASQSRFKGKEPPPTLLMQGSGRFDGVFTFAGTFDGRPAYQRGSRCFLHFCAPQKREGRYFGFVCCGLLFNTAYVHHIR